MHHWAAALLSAVSVIVAVFLVYFALAGIVYFGVAEQAELVLGIILFVVAAIAGWITYTGYRSQFLRVQTGKEALIGAKGFAMTDLKPKGEVRVMGEFWQATAKDQAINSGQAVEVIDVDNIFLIVKATEEKA